MGKKGQAMSMAELAVKFGGDPTAGMLPTQSEGKDFGNSKGKGKGGFRDRDGDSRQEQNDWRGGGGKGGGGFRDRDRGGEPSRSDTGDWFAKDKPAGGGFGRDRDDGDRRGGGGGMRRDDRDDNTRSGGDGDWRGGGGGGGGFRDRDGDRRGGGFGRDEEPRSERPRLNLKPRTADGEKKEDAGPKREGGLASLKSGGEGKYVPAHVKREQEEREKREKAEEDKRAAEVEAERRKEEEKLAAERAKKKAKQDQKDAEKQAAREKMMGGGAAPAQKAKDQTWDDEKLDEFSKACEELVSKPSVDVAKKVKDTTSMLTEDELTTVQPMSRLLELLLQSGRGKADDDVKDIVKRFKPLITDLIEKASRHRFKVKVLCEAQRLAYTMGLPRLSPESALLEVFFDGLYMAEIIEEGYFDLWANSDDDTPGKLNAMFQVNDFLDWLRTAKTEGEESSEDEEEGEEESDEDDSDDDVTENVPKGPRRH